MKYPLTSFLILLVSSLLYISLSNSDVPPIESLSQSSPSNPSRSFVFLTPPESFAYGQITLALELYKRGHRIIFATLDGLQKHFDQQYHSLQINENEQRKLIEPEIISFGPSPNFMDPKMIKLASSDPTYFAKHPALGMQVMKHFEEQFAVITKGIDARESELGSSHVFYSPDSLFVISIAPRILAEHFAKRHQSFVVVLPTAVMSNTLSAPVFAPSPFSGIPSFNKTYMQRIKCLFQSFMLNVVFGRVMPFPIPMLDSRHLYTKPTLKLVASLPPLATLKSYSPLTIFTGPLINKDRTNFDLLDPKLQTILSGSLPVIYVSLGTYAEIGASQIDFIVNSTISEDKQWSVIWSLKEESKNEMNPATAERINALSDVFTIVPWTNTPSILAHKNTALFVSHCGGNGISEAVALGKPILGIPLFGDQHANCRAAHENIGSTVCKDLATDSPSELHELIEEITKDGENHPMSVNAHKAMILSNVAYRGTETAANWLEAAAGLKGDVRMLETPVEREGVIKSYCLDILALALTCVMLIGVIVGVMLPWAGGKIAAKLASKAVDRFGVIAIGSFVMAWWCSLRSWWASVKRPVETVAAPIQQLTPKENKSKNE